MSESKPAFERGDCPCRLLLNRRGRHRFGGPPRQGGVIPRGTDAPLQLVLSLDLTDRNCPITSELGIKALPLDYPFKYSFGGPEIQYAVRSDSEIDILCLSEQEPDPAGRRYLQVDQFPEAVFDLVPLEYEEARVLVFLANDGFFPSGLRIMRHYDEPCRPKDHRESRPGTPDRIGKQSADVLNAPDPICRNPECERYNSLAYLPSIATVPPIPVSGKDDFWHLFRGGDVRFCFGLCYFCGTIISFNVAG
jgi:hypothetical protein